MDVEIYSGMPVTVHQSTRRHKPEGLNLYRNDCENLKSYTKFHVRPVPFISRTSLKFSFKKQRVLFCMSLKFTSLTFQDEQRGSGWPVCGVWRHRVGFVFSVRDRELLWARAPEEPLARAQNALHSIQHSAFWNAWQVKKIKNTI